MRLETGNQLYEGFEQILDTTYECPIDTEFTLPDYCADIQKILKCVIVPEVTSVVSVADSISVEGTADIRALYLDAKGECVRGFETKKEFAFTVRVNSNAEGAYTVVKPSVQHLTCRAMNARRVDIHAALNFSVSASALRQNEIAEHVLNEVIETKCERYEVSRAVGSMMCSFIIDENVDLQNGKPTVDAVLRRAVRYRIEEIEMLPGEIRFSGKATVEVLYRSFSDSVMPERMLFELPFTQNVDAAGVDESCTAEIRCTGGACSIQPREDSVGEYTILNIYLKPVFCLRITKPETVTAVSDAFAVRGILAAKYKTVPMEYIRHDPKRTVRVREVLRIPENDLERVLDIWCDNLSVTAFTERDSSVIRGKFSICVLYLNKEKRVAFTEHILDFTESGAAPAEGRISVEGEIGAIRFAITDAASLECTAEIVLNTLRRAAHAVRTLDAADLEEDAAEDKCRAAIYYASAGEAVWDIAKRYKARVDTIRRYNGCSSEKMEASCPVIICRN